MKHDHATKVRRKLYEAELQRLQAELVTMKEWVRSSGARLLVVFEGRDAAGKGGAIKRISEHLISAHDTDRRIARPDRARARPVVFPALRRAFAGCW